MRHIYSKVVLKIFSYFYFICIIWCLFAFFSFFFFFLNKKQQQLGLLACLCQQQRLFFLSRRRRNKRKEKEEEEEISLKRKILYSKRKETKLEGLKLKLIDQLELDLDQGSGIRFRAKESTFSGTFPACVLTSGLEKRHLGHQECGSIRPSASNLCHQHHQPD